MKPKHSVALFLASIAIGAVLVWFFAAGPSPVEIVSPTEFNEKTEAGAAVYDALKDRLRGRGVIVIGIPPQSEAYAPIVEGFLAKLSEQNPNMVLLKEPRWPELNLKVQSANFDFNSDDISASIEPIRSGIASGQQVVIYTVSIYSTHLIGENAIDRFEKAFGEKIPSLTIGPLTLRHEGENKNEPACVGSMRDLQGLYQLGCFNFQCLKPMMVNCMK